MKQNKMYRQKRKSATKCYALNLSLPSYKYVQNPDYNVKIKENAYSNIPIESTKQTVAININGSNHLENTINIKCAPKIK